MLLQKSTSDPFNIMPRNWNTLLDQQTNSWYKPSVDITEHTDSFHMAVELPGMSREDINVEAAEGNLVISGQRNYPDRKEEGTLRRSEITTGEFARKFTLPDSVDASNISATYENGMLLVNLPKSEEKVSRKIEIT